MSTHRLLNLLILLLCTTISGAHTSPLPVAPSPLANICSETLKEQTIATLMDYSGDEATFLKLIASAAKMGIPQQALLEAKYSFYLTFQNDLRLAELAEDFHQFTPQFEEENSDLFTTVRDWKGVTSFLFAIQAYLNNDAVHFQELIKEAFWLNPKQASDFASLVERFYIQEAQKAYTFTPDFTLTSVEGKTATFRDWITNKKGLIIHFWSPWNAGCTYYLKDFKTTSELLKKEGYAVISVIVQPTESLRKLIPQYLNKLQSSGSDHYYDKTSHSLASTLAIFKLPSMTYVAPTGEIIFCGTPNSPQLWESLKKTTPHLTRPLRH